MPDSLTAFCLLEFGDVEKPTSYSNMNSKKVLSLGCLLTGLMVPVTSYSQTFRIDAEKLRDRNDVAIPQGDGLIMLVGSPDSTFGGPTADSFVSGNDFVIDRWAATTDAESGQTLGPGVLYKNNPSAGPYDLGSQSGWDPGDPVALYWFPELNTTDPAPGEGTYFGTYRNDSGIDGGEPWVTPGSGEEQILNFLTTDAAFPGSSDPTLARADQQVSPVPEPETYALMAGLALLGFAGFRRYKAGTAAA